MNGPLAGGGRGVVAKKSDTTSNTWNKSEFLPVDYTVLGVFIFILLALPFLIGYRKRRHTLLALTFAGRNLGFLIMAFAMFLSENGFAVLTGVPGWAAESGIGIYAFSLIDVLGVITLGWLFMPVYMASGSLTTVDYAKKRFGGRRIEIVMVILMLIINVVTKIAVELYSANAMLARLYDLPYGLVFISLLLGAVLLVSAGGLFSLVYTSVWQFLFFAAGMPAVFLFSYWSFFSWEDIVWKYFRSWPQTTIQHVANSSGYGYAYTRCGIPDKYSMSIIRPHNDPILPWPGMIFGVFIKSVYTFCIDQSILQFCLCGKNIVHAKYACIVNGFFKLLAIFIVVPGFVARILFTDTVACADPDLCEKLCGRRSGCDDLALPLIYQKLVPPGWRGLVLAAFLAASLTSIAAALHAGSTVFTFNLYRTLRPRARETELTIIGKVAIVVQAGVALALHFYVRRIPLIHVFISRAFACLVPPLVAVYLISIFWSHVTEEIAFSTLVVGSCFSFARLAWEISYGTIPCGDEAKHPVPDIIFKFHDLHFAVFLFVICSCYIVLNGMTTDPVGRLHLHRLLFWLRHSQADRVGLNQARRRIKSGAGDGVGGRGRDAGSSFFGRRSSRLTSGRRSKRRPHDDDVDGGDDGGQDGRYYDDDADDYDEEYEYYGEEWEEEEEQESELKKKGEFGSTKEDTGWGAYSNRHITDDMLEKAMKEKTSVRELPRQTRTLNMMLVSLLLCVAFCIAFFT